jgi:hypothetical protein
MGSFLEFLLPETHGVSREAERHLDRIRPYGPE